MASYNPAVTDNSGQILGAGISAGIDNFTKLFLSGMQMRRQDQQQTADNSFRDRQLDLQEKRAGTDRMIDLKRLGLEKEKFGDQKKKFDLGVKDEADFTASGWDVLKQQYPDLIPPELDDKFAGGSLGSKRQLLIQAQAMASRKDATTINAVPVGRSTAYMNNKGATLSVEKPEGPAPQPGFVEMGGGLGVFVGPDGDPVPPSQIVRRGAGGGGPTDMPEDMLPFNPTPGAPQFSPLFPEPPPKNVRKPVLRFDEDAGRYLPYDPDTGAPLDAGTGAATDPYAEFFK